MGIRTRGLSGHTGQYRNSTGRKKYLEEHPEEADEEAQYLDDDIAEWEEKLRDIREDWKPEQEPDMDEEIELIRKWVKNRDKLKNSVAKEKDAEYLSTNKSRRFNEGR